MEILLKSLSSGSVGKPSTKFGVSSEVINSGQCSATLEDTSPYKAHQDLPRISHSPHFFLDPDCRRSHTSRYARSLSFVPRSERPHFDGMCGLMPCEVQVGLPFLSTHTASQSARPSECVLWVSCAAMFASNATFDSYCKTDAAAGAGSLTMSRYKGA